MTKMEAHVAVELPEKFEHVVNNAKDEWLETRGITRDGLRKFIEGRVVRDLDNSPKVGDTAPDFTLEKLDVKGKRTGEMTSLSAYAGKPVGLIFGSYT